MQAMLGGSAGYASWLFRLAWLAMFAGNSDIYGWICSLALFAMLDVGICWLFCLAAYDDYGV
jgi:hypothetical protein